MVRLVDIYYKKFLIYFFILVATIVFQTPCVATIMDAINNGGSYTMTSDEVIEENLGTITKDTVIDGDGYSINGNGKKGMTINSAGNLELKNIGKTEIYTLDSQNELTIGSTVIDSQGNEFKINSIDNETNTYILSNGKTVYNTSNNKLLAIQEGFTNFDNNILIYNKGKLAIENVNFSNIKRVQANSINGNVIYNYLEGYIEKIIGNFVNNYIESETSWARGSAD